MVLMIENQEFQKKLGVLLVQTSDIQSLFFNFFKEKNFNDALC